MFYVFEDAIEAEIWGKNCKPSVRMRKGKARVVPLLVDLVMPKGTPMQKISISFIYVFSIVIGRPTSWGF